MKLLIKLAVVALVANASWRLGTEYLTHYRFADSVQEAAIDSGQTDAQLRQHVLELAATISQCAAVITNDSGPLHVATALAVPSVSIFGPTDPERTVIPGATRVIRRTLACQPCYQRECPLGHHRCMAEVSVDEVFNAAVGMFEAIERPAAEISEPHVALITERL